jgi:uncharacterized protein (DUF169 family)
MPIAEYPEASEALKKALRLTGSPVAIRIVHNKNEIPPEVEKLDKTVRHCQMVTLARKEGKIFYSTVENHDCMGGAWSLGLREISETLKNGDFYFKLGKFESAAASKRTIERIPHLESGTTYATMYAPLEKAPFIPQVILIVATPWAMLKLAQATLFQLGGRIQANFSGIQSVCADATAQTYLTGCANYSVGCDGSKRFSGIGDEEMVMGFPAELLPSMVHTVEVITAAPGSKK